ncbi:MAG: hypothetical protein VYD19_10480 [Myxococcota bacterium]|nr:hypothetical protein [Myxococcota bacterium]
MMTLVLSSQRCAGEDRGRRLSTFLFLRHGHIGELGAGNAASALEPHFFAETLLSARLLPL